MHFNFMLTLILLNTTIKYEIKIFFIYFVLKTVYFRIELKKNLYFHCGLRLLDPTLCNQIIITERFVLTCILELFKIIFRDLSF